MFQLITLALGQSLLWERISGSLFPKTFVIPTDDTNVCQIKQQQLNSLFVLGFFIVWTHCAFTLFDTLLLAATPLPFIQAWNTSPLCHLHKLVTVVFTGECHLFQEMLLLRVAQRRGSQIFFPVLVRKVTVTHTESLSFIANSSMWSRSNPTLFFFSFTTIMVRYSSCCLCWVKPQKNSTPTQIPLSCCDSSLCGGGKNPPQISFKISRRKESCLLLMLF